MSDGVPSPKAILRGHKAQIHAATFIRRNERLLTGDAEGYVVLWDLTIMRPKAVWRAHEKAILGIADWGHDKIITHGRDHRLIVWRVGLDDEEHLSKTPPVEDVPAPRPRPWMVHLLEVNTMNFCSFAATPSNRSESMSDTSEILIAVPNTLNSEAIDIYSLPSQNRLHTIHPGHKNGMAMALALFHHQDALTIIAAWENGFATVDRLRTDGRWITTYRSQAHSQPILSLGLHPSREFFLSSGADSIIAKHPIPLAQQEVISEPSTSERVVDVTDEPLKQSSASLLSAALKSSNSGPSTTQKLQEWKHPLKVANTKHSGQQSLQIRSDGRIFVTAGWDSKARVYSTKTLKELAVLKWHQVGCYAVATSGITVADGDARRPGTTASLEGGNPTSDSSMNEKAVTTRGPGAVARLNTGVKERRIAQAKTAHWIAAGAKDGKISLWDIY